MNCRPGDLARVISPGVRMACPFCGGLAVIVDPDTFVTCVALTDDSRWILKKPISFGITFECGFFVLRQRGLVTAIEDHLLRPIRDPGDEALDEVLALVGAPVGAICDMEVE